MQKTVVITGGSRGIGRSLTEGFVAAGYHVVVGARSESGITAVAPNKVRFVAVDACEEASHRKLVAAARDWTGGLDVYVNNAGVSEWRPIAEIDDAFFEDMMAVNLKSAFWGAKAAAAAFTDGGVIVNISSIAGKRGSSNNAMYVAAKFGMNGLTQSLAKELGPRNIRVNALCPVLIRTDGLIEALKSKWSPAKGDPDAFLADFMKGNSALGRLPTGEDVSAMAVYLASDAAAGMTGQCINVDCGVFPQ
jgi:NAD(P)-dependent dehydrogenase (short-subunit alcohol dehydrogenase family)